MSCHPDISKVVTQTSICPSRILEELSGLRQEILQVLGVCSGIVSLVKAAHELLESVLEDDDDYAEVEGCET